MTVIAYRDGVMAADTAVFRGSVISGQLRKIVRFPNGDLYAASGHASNAAAVQKALINNEALPTPIEAEDFGAILVRAADRRVVFIDGHMTPYDASPAEFYALGCADEFVMGALAAGATAEEAIRLAILYCDYPAGEVQVEHL